MEIDLDAIDIDMATVKRLLVLESDDSALGYILECVREARVVDDNERSNGRRNG